MSALPHMKAIFSEFIKNRSRAGASRALWKRLLIVGFLRISFDLSTDFSAGIEFLQGAFVFIRS